MSLSEVRVDQIGNLAAAPEMSYVGAERTPRTTMLVITNKKIKDKDDNPVERVTRIRWTLWGPQAENAAKYLGKGSPVAISGRVENNDYEKNGETVYDMQFTVADIKYLDSKAAAEARAARGGTDGDGGTGDQS